MKVLIVDDEPDLCELIAYSVQLEGHEAIEAHSGREAIELLRSGQVDAVLSDVRMPNGTGLDILEEIQKRPEPRPRVYLMTGYSDLTEDVALQKGAQALFSKPFELDRILDELLMRK